MRGVIGLDAAGVDDRAAGLHMLHSGLRKISRQRRAKRFGQLSPALARARCRTCCMLPMCACLAGLEERDDVDSERLHNALVRQLVDAADGLAYERVWRVQRKERENERTEERAE